MIKQWIVYMLVLFLVMWVGALLMSFATPQTWYFLPAILTYTSLMGGCLWGFFAQIGKDKYFKFIEANDE